MGLLDFLYPKRCVQCKRIGSYLCDRCFSYLSFIDHMVCAVCQRQALGGMTHPVCHSKYTIDGIFSSLVYQGVVKKLVYTFKYPPYLTDLQPLLVQLFYEGIIQKEQFYTLLDETSVFVPIPLHIRKYRRRGYNQAQLLADGLAKYFAAEVLDCLERIKETQTQVGLPKDARAENIKNAFVINPVYAAEIASLQQVFLVDDVATSGATMREAAKVLKHAGVKKVWGITLAHGE